MSAFSLVSDCILAHGDAGFSAFIPFPKSALLLWPGSLHCPKRPTETSASRTRFYSSVMATGKHISNLLASQSSGLQNLMEKAAVLDQLTRNLRGFLDAPLNQHISVANIRDRILVITADSSAWLTMARYQAPVLLDFIRQETGLELVKIHFKVISSTGQSTETYFNQPSMSRSTSLLLESTAQSIVDPDLSAAVKRLARRGS